MADDEAYEDFQIYDDNGSYEHDRNSSIDYYDFNHMCEKHDVRRFAMYFLPPFYAVTLIAGLAGNAVVVAIYANYKRMRSKTDLYIMNLAIADLLLLVTLPFWAANAVHGWVFGEAMCKICSALSEMNFCAGMLFLACISVDRYLAVSRVARPPTVGRKARLACLGVWLVALVLSAPDVVFSSVVESHGRRQCMLVFPPQMAKAAKATVQVFDILLAFAVPSLVMLFCYTAVAKAVYRGTERKKSRALTVLLAVVGVFFLTQLPYNMVKFCRLLDLIHTLIRDCEASKMVDVATQVTESIALFHSCLNPILYAFMGASFKGHVVKAVKRSRFWRRDQDVAIAMETSVNLTSPDSERTSSFSI